MKATGSARAMVTAAGYSAEVHIVAVCVIGIYRAGEDKTNSGG